MVSAWLSKLEISIIKFHQLRSKHRNRLDKKCHPINEEGTPGPSSQPFLPSPARAEPATVSQQHGRTSMCLDVVRLSIEIESSKFHCWRSKHCSNLGVNTSPLDQLFFVFLSHMSGSSTLGVVTEVSWYWARRKMGKFQFHSGDVTRSCKILGAHPCLK